MWITDFFKGKTLDNEADKVSLGGQIALPNNDGAITVENPVNNFILNFDWTANSQADLIDKYREIAQYNEVDFAIQDIINEMVSFAEDEEPVKVDLDGVELSEAIKKRILEKWDKVSSLLSLKDTIHQKAYDFYIDGRLSYQKVVDSKNLKKGLVNIVELNPKFITKVRNVNYNKETHTIDSIDEYFIYNENNPTTNGAQNKQSTVQFKEALQLTKESITYVTSGLVDSKSGYAISWLHKAVKPANQLQMMENALVIYRITRAPERRVFYIDVGNLPKSKAEQYLNNFKNSFRNRMSYDHDTGTFKDQRHLMTMQEDFWLPRNSAGRGTEVTTLPGGANLDSIEDVVYFLKRLYKALNVPVSRLEPDAIASLGGRAAEVNRDELKFSKYVSKIRKRFNMMFKDLLKTELILSNIIKESEWAVIDNNIKFIYAQDMYLEERKFFEMTRDRIELAKDMTDYTGRYFSNNYIRTKILRQTEEDIKENDDEIAAEVKIKQFNTDDEEDKN